MTDWMTTSSVEERQRVLDLTPNEREEELKKWIKESNLSHSMKIDIAVGFNKLELYGVNVVKHILAGKETSSKPFGKSGLTSFNTITYAMCNLTHGSRALSEHLYDGYTHHIENYLNEDIVPFLADKHDYVLLKEFSDVWNSHKVLTNWMYKLFNQIDRTHVGLHKGKKSITSCALHCFYRIVFHDVVRKRVRECVLHFMAQERSGVNVDRDQLKSCVQMFELMGMAANVSDVKSIAEATNLPTDISIYRMELERPLLEASAEYYSLQRVQLLGECSMLSYFAQVERAVRGEETRVKAYLNPATLPRIQATVMQELMIVPSDRVKESFHGILRSADSAITLDSKAFPSDFCAHIKTVFALLLQIQDLPAMVSSSATDAEDSSSSMFTATATGATGTVANNDDLMNAFVEEFEKFLLEGVLKIRDMRASYSAPSAEGEGEAKQVTALTGSAKAAADIEFIKNCISFNRRVSLLLSECLQSFSQLRHCLQGAITKLMGGEIDAGSADPVTPTDMLVVYLDKCLRKDNKDQAAVSEADMDAVLVESVHLFKTIRDKDVFIELYKDALSKRLLNNKSASLEEEKSIIGKLKSVQGVNFTIKVEGMLVDMGTSEVSNKEFQVATQGIYKEFSAQVLSTNWKLPSASRILVPPVMQRWIDVYSDFYLASRPNMVLKWLYKAGEAVVKFTDKGKRSFELVMLPIQAMVLLQFHDRDHGEAASLSFGDISEHSGVTEIEILKRILHSLSCSNKVIKTPLLCKFPNESRHISEHDRFSVNPGFISRLRRITVPIGSLDIDMSSTRTVQAAVETSRKCVLEACVVRIMKARKVLSHMELTAEVMRQVVSFAPQVRAIKTTIEALIEREYLERSDKGEYTYLA